MTKFQVLLSLLALGGMPNLAKGYDFSKEKDPHAGLDNFNGYSLSQFPDFVEKWKLVTVRFRKDSDELRFVYANPSAWKTLQAGEIDYPDGAIFAKIGIHAEEDPAFTSSAVPSGAKRVQFMVRDKKKHADSDGWGYALFDASGKTFPGEPKLAAVACHACHKLVPERGFVFSQVASLYALGPKIMSWQGALADKKRLTYVDIARKTLPMQVQKLLPASVKVVRSLEGELKQNLFPGTLDEIRPSLAQESLRASLPAILLSQNEETFSLIFKVGSKHCPAKSISVVSYVKVSGAKDGLKKHELCL